MTETNTQASRLDAIEARANRTAAYPFADKLSREDVPYLLDLARKQQAAIERVESIHAPCQMFEYDDVNGVFILDDDGDKKVMATICRGCTPEEVIEDAEDWGYDDGRAVNYPCPTIKTLEPTPRAAK